MILGDTLCGNLDFRFIFRADKDTKGLPLRSGRTLGWYSSEFSEHMEHVTADGTIALHPSSHPVPIPLNPIQG